jgi:type IV secretory pathway VirB3-like protein
MLLLKVELIQASISGLFKTILMVIGGLVLLRFIGQLMHAKRNIAEEQELNRKQKAFEKERNEKLRNFGKTTISKNKNVSNVEDVSYQEVK